MKVLLVYDTVSESKMTGKIAEIVVAAMREEGAQVDSFFVEDAGNAKVKDYGCLVVGAPTMAWKPSQRMKKYLDSLSEAECQGKLAAAFDTQLKSGLSGDATKHMEKSLTKVGFKIVSPALLSYVESENKLYKLKEGESEKAKAWGHELARKLSK
jgi:flavorubredoxin